MTYELSIGDRAYSSWSMRAWLLFDVFGIPVRVRRSQLYTETFAKMLVDYPPARKVPILTLPEGGIVADSLAIAEELASRHPDLGLWPTNPALRAAARMLTAEMHSAFSSLRDQCPMNLRRAHRDVPVDTALADDLARIQRLWDHAFSLSGSDGWLFGGYGVADAFFAPVAARIAGYDLPVSDRARAYVDLHLADPSFRRWRAMGHHDGADQAIYDLPWPRTDWPGPAPATAHATEGPSVNAACPYSGEPVTHFLDFGGTTYGFCNVFCRDKTLSDPEVWPKFTALVDAAR
jgi:glutathione S-transferase